MPISEDDLRALAEAKRLLENPGLAAKLTHYVGAPIEKGFELLPTRWRDKVVDVTREALEAALKVAIASLRQQSSRSAQPRLHKLAATASGAAGGAFGLAALAIELPVSTTIICRSIADIARSQGEDLSLPEARMACLEVFAFGGTTPSDDASETAYFAVRAALSRAVSEAAEYLTTRQVTESGAPALVRLVSLIATRFKVQVSQKAAAMAIPLVGAAGGATINYLFLEHFQAMSHGHFTIRRLERQYGEETVRQAYVER
ncbi:MAG: EcsC family protein [Burkholderiaceae bacterium]|nr:EcsC family protein [Burkholderiaceae bacterium]MEB2351031.1 EcsC family protein [Burkholderiaceae bacterium]